VDEKRFIKISKYLSKYLRHQPQGLELTLALGGWVDIDTLLAACRRHDFVLSKAELEEVVALNDKQRFSFDPTGTRIRANQGHSVEVDLQLEAAVPPALLYHGTGKPAVAIIWDTGISKMSRQHVHLSANLETAIKVGRRHGSPVVFHIDSFRMNADNFVFYRSENGVWLTDYVPVLYLLKTTE